MHQWHAAKASPWVTWLAWLDHVGSNKNWLHEAENRRWHERSTSVKFEVQDSWLLGWGEACMVWFEYENTHGSLGNTGMDRNLWMHKLDLPYSFQTAQGNWTFFKCWDVHFDHSWTDLVPNPQILLLKDVLSFPSLCCYRKKIRAILPMATPLHSYCWCAQVWNSEHCNSIAIHCECVGKQRVKPGLFGVFTVTSRFHLFNMLDVPDWKAQEVAGLERGWVIDFLVQQTALEPFWKNERKHPVCWMEPSPHVHQTLKMDWKKWCEISEVVFLFWSESRNRLIMT